MDLSLTLPRSVVVAVSMLACSLIHAETPSNRVVDLRYGIPTWHQPLGVPDDWHKPMANERGALLYDFGPGPYVQPSTSVQATAAGEAFKFERQEWVDSPRVPVVRSILTRGSDSIQVTTLALPPTTPAVSDGRTGPRDVR